MEDPTMSYTDTSNIPGTKPTDESHQRRIAVSRALDRIDHLRDSAEFLRGRLEIYAGTGLGDWYAEMARRLEQAANDVEIHAGESE